jgi:carboxyl-terminal processing protease
MTLTRSDREKLLTKIQNLVQKHFYDPTFHGKNWGVIVDRHRSSILASESTEAFESAVTSMFEELDSSGLGILSEHTKITPRNAINASFHKVDTVHEGSRWVFQDVLPGGVAERAGVRPGDALVSAAGLDIIPPQRPAFAMGENTPAVISRNGTRKETRLSLATPTPKYKDNPYSEPNSITASVINDSTATVKVSLFPGKIGIDFANRVRELFSKELVNVERLVIDLRGNPGGGVGGLQLMSYLTADKRPVGYSLTRKTSEEGYDKNRLPRFSRIPASKLEIPLLAMRFLGKKSVVLQTEGLGHKRFHGKTVLLINEHSTGAAEMVIQFAKENRLATLVGTKTPGRLVSRSAFKIGAGYRITIPIGAYISWNGDRIEGRGIEPDVAVDWSYDEALKGIDNQLNQALQTANSL